MFQLKNLINRSLVPHDPEKNMKAAEDFMLLLLHSYVCYAGQLLQSSDYEPSVKDLTDKIVEKFVSFPRH